MKIMEHETLGTANIQNTGIFRELVVVSEVLDRVRPEARMIGVPAVSIAPVAIEIVPAKFPGNQPVVFAYSRPLGIAAFTLRVADRLNSSHLGISYAVFCLRKNSSHLGISSAAFCFKTNSHSRRSRRLS